MARRSRSKSLFGDLVEGPENFVARKRLRSNSFFVDKKLAENSGNKEFANELREKWMKINRNRRLSLGLSPKKIEKKSSKQGFERKWINLKNVRYYFVSYSQRIIRC